MKLIKSSIHRLVTALACLAALVLVSAVVATPASAATATCSSSTPASQRPTLYQGDSGSCVREAQRLLNQHIGTSLKLDGKFGPATAKAVRSYQAKFKIKQTGNVGPITWSSLLKPAKPKPKPVSTSVKPTRSNCYSSSSLVNLSFDDTASDKALNSILATLKSKNVKAIFFFNTNNTSLAKFKRIRAEGHVVANHTFNHPKLTSLSRSGVIDQVKRGRNQYTNSVLVRPPYGATNATVSGAISSLGYKECLWTVDTMDWSTSASPSASAIVNRVRNGDKWTARVGAGGMILMHGTGRHTPSALPGVIDAVRARGLEMPKLR